MGEPLPGETACMITVFPVPGKYAPVQWESLLEGLLWFGETVTISTLSDGFQLFIWDNFKFHYWENFEETIATETLSKWMVVLWLQGRRQAQFLLNYFNFDYFETRRNVSRTLRENVCSTLSEAELVYFKLVSILAYAEFMKKTEKSN